MIFKRITKENLESLIAVRTAPIIGIAIIILIWISTCYIVMTSMLLMMGDLPLYIDVLITIIAVIISFSSMYTILSIDLHSKWLLFPGALINNLLHKS